MNTRRSPSGPELPTVIGQFAAQTIPAGNFADVTISGIPNVHPGDPVVIALGDAGTVSTLPLNVRCTAPGTVVVTIWNVSGIGQTIDPPGLVFKLVFI